MPTQVTINEALSCLRKSIEGDKRFFKEAQNDPKFRPIRKHVYNLLVQMTREKQILVKKEQNKCLRFKSILFSTCNYSIDTKDKIEGMLAKMGTLINKGKYLDLLESEMLINNINNTLQKIFDGHLVSLEKQIKSLQTEFNECDNRIEAAEKDKGSMFSWFMVLRLVKNENNIKQILEKEVLLKEHELEILRKVQNQYSEYKTHEVF